MEHFRYALMVVCLAALAAGAVAFFAYCASRVLFDFLPRVKRVCGIGGVVAVVALIIYGGTKPQTPRIQWDIGLADNGSFFDTNAWQFITFKWKKIGPGSTIPDSQPLFFAYRPRGRQDLEWGLLSQSTVGAYTHTAYPGENPTNFEYYAYTSFVPPTPVHTNGVWVGNILMRPKRGGDDFIVIHGQVQENGRVISPLFKKKEEE